MLRAVRLARAGVCAAVALLMTTTPARAQDFTTWLFAEGSTSGLLGFEKEMLLAQSQHQRRHRHLRRVHPGRRGHCARVTLTVEPLSRGRRERPLHPGVGDRAGIALRVTATRADHRRAHDVLGRRPVPRRPASGTDGQRHARRPQREGRRCRRPRPGTSPRAKASSSTPSSRWPTRTTRRPRVTRLLPRRQRCGGHAGTTSSRPTRDGRSGRRRCSVRASSRAGRLCHHRHFRSRCGRRAADVLGAGRAFRHPRRPCGGGRDHAVGARGCLPRASRARCGAAERLRHVRAALQPERDADRRHGEVLRRQDGTMLAEDARAPSVAWRATTCRRQDAARRSSNQAFCDPGRHPTQPFVAERAVYWRGLLEGTATAGATAAGAASGALPKVCRAASRCTRTTATPDKRRFNTFFPIYNPGLVPATVTVYFYTEGGNSGVTKTIDGAGAVARDGVAAALRRTGQREVRHVLLVDRAGRHRTRRLLGQEQQGGTRLARHPAARRLSADARAVAAPESGATPDRHAQSRHAGRRHQA